MFADFLGEMARSSRERTFASRASLSFSELQRRSIDLPRPPQLARRERFGVIAEVKMRSPSEGRLAESDVDPAVLACVYARSGAAAVSVLTEPTRFSGSLDHLAVAAEALREHDVPAMRKDFIVDLYQIFEARIFGAGGILLIVRLLSDAVLREMLEAAKQLSMFAILEAFSEHDVERIAAFSSFSETALVGVNCRDLSTLKIGKARFFELAERLPASLGKVAESGVENAADAALIAAAGYDFILAGSALMRATDAGAALERLIAAGREAKR